MGNEIIDHEVKIEKHRSTEVSEYTLVDLISDIQSAATAYVLHNFLFTNILLYLYVKLHCQRKRRNPL